jgi:hypothetical protein
MKKQTKARKAKSTRVKPKELFEVVRAASDKSFEQADKFAPRFIEAVATLRREYFNSARETVNIALDVQESLSRRVGITPKVPRQVEDTIRANAEALIRLQDELMLASLNVTQQFVKGMNTSTKAATELVRAAADFWLSFLKRDASVKAA